MTRDLGCYFGRSGPPCKEHGGRLPIALVYPGPGKLAVSSLGWQSVFRSLWGSDQFAVERFYFDGNDTRPRSEESGRALSSFPLVAFSLTFEEDYSVLVKMLESSDINLLASGRESYPLILAGGPPAFLNPAPITPFVDMFWVGEAETCVVPLFERLKDHVFEGDSKEGFLRRACSVPGVYVPGLSPLPVKRIYDRSTGSRLETPAYSCFISNKSEFRDTLLVEVNRGCPFGCRFCAAGYIYRPPRQTDIQTLKEIVEYTNPLKVGLVGTALTNWPDLMEFLVWLKERKTKFSLSSVRADGLTPELMGFLRLCGIRTITLALEGPSARLRKAAGKKLDEDDFLRAVAICSKYGINHLKIYLIVGWPGEDDSDYDQFEDFLDQIEQARKQGMGKRTSKMMRITISSSCLTPKPFTPLQFAPMATEDQLKNDVARLKNAVKKRKAVTFSPPGIWQARLQGLLARGGEELADLIVDAAAIGWKKAYKKWGSKGEAYLDRTRAKDEPLPWDAIDVGVDRDLLWRQWERYLKAMD